MIFWVLRFLWKLFVSIQLRWYIYSLCCSLLISRTHFLARCENSFEYFFPATGEDIATKARPLFQKPVHLAILVEDITSLDVQSLAKMVSWSYAAGIYDVTLFDGDGYLKTHRSEVFDLVEQETEKFLKQQQPHLSGGVTHSFLTIVPSPMELLLEAKKSGKLGSTNKSKLPGDGELLAAKEQSSKQSYRLRLTSLEDGKERILQTVKNLALRVRDGDFDLTQIAGFTFMNDILMGILSLQLSVLAYI